MNFQDLPTPILALRVKSVNGYSFGHHVNDESESSFVRAITPSDLQGVFDLSLHETIVPVRPIEENRVRQLNHELAMGRTLVAEITDLAADGSVELRIAFFPGPILHFGDVEIGVDEYVVSSLFRLGNTDADKVFEFLSDEFVFNFGDEIYFLAVAGPAIRTELNPEVGVTAGDGRPANVTDLVSVRGSIAREFPEVVTSSPNASNSFCVVGRNFRFVATSTKVQSDEEIFVVTRLTENRNQKNATVRLAKGHIQFDDWTLTGKVKLLATAQLADLTIDKSSYLKRWDQYLELEGESFLNEIIGFGCLKYSKVVQRKDGTVSVQITEADDSALRTLETMRQNQELSHVAVRPDYLKNSKITFSEFTQNLLREDDALNSLGSRESQNHDRLGFVRWDKETRTLVLEAETLPKQGMLVLSTRGNVAQIKRRERARRQILEGRTANPQLGLLIEEGGRLNVLRSPQRVKPLTAFVREKVFKNPPTYMQERAIEVALNTPDVALIQGPPGTGKTTVIAAILERLNELSTRDGIIRSGQVLLTGFQQDAVENMIDRISLNGLPVPKFGNRSGIKSAKRSAFERNLEEWCAEIAANLRKKNPQVSVHEEERQISDLVVQYLQMPSNRLAMMLMQSINQLNSLVFREKLGHRVAAMEQKLAVRERLVSNENHLLPVVRSIRVKNQSFADDGPQRAADALDKLDEFLSPEERDLLQRASCWDPQKGVPPFMANLFELKSSLAYKLTVPPVFRIEKHNDEVLEIANAAIQCLREVGSSALDRKTSAIVSFLAELENNVSGMIDAVSAYSFAYSATVQQSVGGEVRRRKGTSQSGRSAAEEELIEYEYVIVDEAARVTPPDLMIALAQGKRIVLVGDHRQLPQIIEKSIEAQLEDGSQSDGETAWLKRSMFEYLFSDRLKSLEENDGIQRRVTLDKQFRMHPELGSFISRNFYERHDPSEKFDSGLPAESFVHDLPGTHNAFAIWVDVPYYIGKEVRPGTSYVRQAEIDPIVQMLTKWITSSEGQYLTYGVISFYKAQADQIQLVIHQRLGMLLQNNEQVKVGTVDSFQGMEFDVVLLSVVRTGGWSSRSSSTDGDKEAMRAFGHLCLSNRLNVSMSRQKKLLVVVGDSELVSHPLADEYIPGLVDFHRIATLQAIHPNGNGK
jgi:hypothetical protein